MKPRFWNTVARYARPHGPWLALCLFGRLCTEGFFIGFALMLRPITDAVLGGNLTAAQPLLIPLFALLAPIAAIMWLGLWAYARFVGATVQDFRNALARHVQHLPISRIERESSGDLIARVNTGSATLASLLDGLPELLIFPLSFVGALVAMLTISWPLTLLTLLLAIPSAWISQRVMQPIEVLARERSEREGAVASIMQDALSGVAVVKAYGLQSAMLARLAPVFKRIDMLTVQMERRNTLGLAPFFLAHYLPEIVVPLAAGALAVRGDLSTGGVVAVLTLYFGLIQPIIGVLQWRTQLNWLRPPIQRALDVLELPGEPGGNALNLHVGQSVAPIALNDVHFSYDDAHAPVLRGVSFEVPAGKTVALVGASGGGKSSIIKLLCGFYAAQSGAILVYGQPLNALDPDSARQVMSLVSQDTYLFPGSIAENIQRGRPAASFDEVVSAARAANADDFIRQQLEGYQTHVGERGVLLSGGQRQRIALARAILKDTPILLLDEPTAALDNESERLIQDALARFSANRATLVVAHRLSTIRDADEIIVLEGGIVAERGTHTELIAANGVYLRLLALQQNTAVQT